MTLTKMQGILGLFMILVVILLINPGLYNNMYNNILGRVFLIILLIFFAMNNVTLGLLVALIIIIGTNMSFIEGMESGSGSGSDVKAAVAAKISAVKDSVAAKNSIAANTSSDPTSYSDSSDSSDSSSPDSSDSSSPTPSPPTPITLNKGVTIGDDNVTSHVGTIQVTTRSSSKDKSSKGVDKQALEETIKSIPSNTVHVSKENFTSSHVNAAEPLTAISKFSSQYAGF